ncbi:hypothetical protein [Aneurinibacillus migulanus]|uniref:hypothetical protein n=1 Tax=Aneurinibacillus migulanus TaxID=47500 RepID=UPI001F3E8EEA|nr:hypothetical protein [Aneurinibacillus migulanus]
MINRQILVVRGKKRMKKLEVEKKRVCLFSAGAQGVSTLFFPHLSYFQPRYHVKISSVIYINHFSIRKIIQHSFSTKIET